MNEHLIGLGIRLTELLAKNTASSIHDKITAIKSKKDDKATINAMNQIINDLITDKHEAINISRAFEEELQERKISEADIEYISNRFIPVIEKLLKSTSTSEESEDLNSMISILKPIISVETFTILQLLGFNFKKGVGEPLTCLLSKFIESQQPSPDNAHELQKLTLKREIELYKIINDENSYERFKELSS